MNRLKEYISLVKRGIPNIDKIAEGMLNQVKQEFNALPEDQQEEIAKRRLICESCPLFSLNAKSNDEEYQKLFKKPFEFIQTSSGKIIIDGLFTACEKAEVDIKIINTAINLTFLINIIISLIF